MSGLCPYAFTPHALSSISLNTVAWVSERTIPSEQPPLVSEVSANFFSDGGRHVVSANGSLRQYSRLSRPGLQYLSYLYSISFLAWKCPRFVILIWYPLFYSPSPNSLRNCDINRTSREIGTNKSEWKKGRVKLARKWALFDVKAS
jgi:hypothetical protein